MTLWQDGMANNMTGLDNHTNVLLNTVSQKHMKWQSPSSVFISSLSWYLAPSLSGHICWAQPGCTGHFLLNHHHHHTENPFPLRQMYIWYRNTNSYGQNRKRVTSTGWRDYTTSLERRKQYIFLCVCENTSHRTPNICIFNQYFLALKLLNVLLNTKLSCPPVPPNNQIFLKKLLLTVIYI